MTKPTAREHWGTRLGFILAAAGSAIGIGNVWQFPFIAGRHGGAAFVLFYLFCLAFIGFPVMLIELALGRRTQKNPVGAYGAIAGSRSLWIWAGGMGVLAGFLILSFYSVVGGWCIGYILKSLTGAFSTFDTTEAAEAEFKALSGDPWLPILYHGVFMALCIGVVAKGVRSGIERASRILMPTLLVLLLTLVFRGLSLEGSGEGVEFLFRADFRKLDTDGMLAALGQAFFTLSLGMGAMITYGSYLSKKNDLVTSAGTVIFLDTAIALLAGLAIFTAVFAYKFDPQGGPPLIFNVLPVVFGKMAGGTIFALLFFLLLTIAALTSGISLLEVVISFLVDEKRWSRVKAAWTFGGLIFLMGVPCALSYGPWADVKMFDLTFFDFFFTATFKYMLPIGGFLILIFAMARWTIRAFVEELRHGTRWRLPPAWLIGGALSLAAILVLVTFVAGLFDKGG